MHRPSAFNTGNHTTSQSSEMHLKRIRLHALSHLNHLHPMHHACVPWRLVMTRTPCHAESDEECGCIFASIVDAVHLAVSWSTCQGLISMLMLSWHDDPIQTSCAVLTLTTVTCIVNYIRRSVPARYTACAETVRTVILRVLIPLRPFCDKLLRQNGIEAGHFTNRRYLFCYLLF